MATITTRVDDLTGVAGTSEKPVDEVKFSINGTRYTIDLSAESLDKLNKALKPFTDKAVEVPPVGASDTENAKIRAWAKANGKQVNDKGAIPQSIKDEYHAANPPA